MANQVDLSQFRFISAAKVRFCETDANGHMSHVTSVIYMEQARTDFMSALGLFSRERMKSEGKTFVLASQTVNYGSQAYFHDAIDTYVRVSRIGTSSLEMEYALVNLETGALVSSAASTIVYFDIPSQKSAPLPADLADRIAKLEISCPHKNT